MEFDAKFLQMSPSDTGKNYVKNSWFTVWISTKIECFFCMRHPTHQKHFIRIHLHPSKIAILQWKNIVYNVSLIVVWIATKIQFFKVAIFFNVGYLIKGTTELYLLWNLNRKSDPDFMDCYWLDSDLTLSNSPKMVQNLLAAFRVILRTDKRTKAGTYCPLRM